MFQHHKETIRNITDKLKKSRNIEAIIVGGSIAHGYAKPESDVDIMIVVPHEEYEERIINSKLWFSDLESCTYKGGYIDGKYISKNFMELVAEKGSEPARFAFEGAIIAYSKIVHLQQLIDSIAIYPIKEKEKRIKHFYCQLQSWKWFYDEALKKANKYLLNYSISNIVLFGGRLLLAHNEVLYPYHKWFLQALEGMPQKPDNLISDIDVLMSGPSKETVDTFYKNIMEFHDWGCKDMNFADYFIKNNELNWLTGNTPIADL